MSTINNRASASMVSGSSSADSITNSGSYSTVDAGEGKDTIVNAVEVGSGLHNDSGLIQFESVNFQGLYSSISGGADNDVIIDQVGYSTINAGTGNDTITLGAYSTFEYADGDGNDVISNYSPDNAIHITSGSLKSTINSGKNIVLTVGSGKITLKGAKGMALNIVDADSEVSAPSVKPYDKCIIGTDDSDTLYIQNPSVTVLAGNGDDLVINDFNIGLNSMLKGGNGNDSLVSNSRGLTLDGGNGDDIIELSGREQTVVFRSIDGNDTVVGYQSTDTVHVVDGSSYSTQQSGDNIILTVGDGSITFKDVVDQTLIIDDTPIDSEVPELAWVIAEPSTSGIDYNKRKGLITVGANFNGEVDAANFDYNSVSKIDASAVTESVELRAGKPASILTAGKGETTLIGGVGNDKLYGGKGSDTFVYIVGEGQDVIGNNAKGQENTLLQDQDVIVIVGDDIYDVSDVTIKDNKLATIITFPGDKKSKLTINKTSVDTPLRFYFGSSAETALEMGEIVYGVLPDGVHYASGNNYNRLNVDDTLDGEIIDTKYFNSQIVTVDASNAEGYLEIRGNANNNVLKASKMGSWLAGGAGNDQLYGSTDEEAFDIYEIQMQTAGKKDVIYNYKSGDQIIIDTTLLEDGEPYFDEESGVISYDGAKDNFNGFNDNKNDVVITLNKKNTLTIKDAAGKPVNIYDSDGNPIGTFGHVLPDGLTYNQKRTDIIVSDVEVAESFNDVLNINLSNEDEYANKYFSTAVNVDLSELGLDVYLSGSAKNNVLKAGGQYSWLTGGSGNDQLYGSTVEGANVDFVYSIGKDTVYNYDSDTDYIYIAGDTAIDFDVLMNVTAKNFVEKGNDVILNIDKNNSLTIKDGVGKVIEVFDDNGALDEGTGYVRYDFSLPDGLKYDSTKRTAIMVDNSETFVEPGGISIDLSNETEDYYTFATTVKKVDLSAANDENFGAVIIGNEQSNTLSAPNGGFNELYGGHQEFDDPKKAKPSADYLIGGSGDDVFVYAPDDGKDQIINYGANDIIRLDDTYDYIESVMISDRKNVVSVTLNGDNKNSVFTITKDDINTPITFQALVSEVNGLDDWRSYNSDGFVYGPDEDMSLSADGSKLMITGELNKYVYANANMISSMVKTIDARESEDVYLDIIGNANANQIYAGDGGSYLDGGYDVLKQKATNDTLVGGDGEDAFVYNFVLGLGGKDMVTNFDAENDYIVFDLAPKSVTTNGKDVVFNFEDKIDGKKYSGSLTVKGLTPITSETAVYIDVAGDAALYQFGSKLKNASWEDSSGITVNGGDESVEDDTLEGNTADAWTKLSDTSYAYDYGGVQFTISGSAVKDQTPGNYFAPNSLTVIEEDGIPDGILVDTSNKQIILSDQLDMSNVEFTFAEDDDAGNYDWVTYSLMETSYELPAVEGEYWFEGAQALSDDGALDSIIVKETAIDLPDDQLLSSALKASTNELTFAARHRSKK